MLSTIAYLLAFVLWATPKAAPRVALAAEIDRLIGHKLTLSPDGKSYMIDDIAGDGTPWVGRVEQRGDKLWLRPMPSGPALLLVGPLAQPRIAGPGYKIWALGKLAGSQLTVHRLGVLAGPLATSPRTR